MWAGPGLIPGDPNLQNNNGKMFAEFMNRNSNLTLVNSQQVCEGLISRIRKTKNKTEQSILDFFIVCEKVMPFVTKMIIDEAREHVLTNFNPIRTGGRAIESDHNTEILKLNLQYERRKMDRIELFNFKNIECQENFNFFTSETNDFSDCFKLNLSFKEKTAKWKKTLDSFCYKSFKKVRITPHKPQITKISELMEERKTIKYQIKMCEDMKKREDLLSQIENVDQIIAKECSEENFQKIKDNFQCLSGDNDQLNCNGMWSLMKKVFPKNTLPLPVGKKNRRGQIITNPEKLKDLYLETYVHRLRPRPIKKEYSQLKTFKETLFDLRLNLCKLRKSEPWTESNLNVVLKSLKKNKARDPHGLINDLFKPEVTGSDLSESLLSLMNGIKENCYLPEFIQ